MEYVEVLKDVEVLKYQLAGLFDTLQQAETKNHDIDHTMNKLKGWLHNFSPKSRCFSVKNLEKNWEKISKFFQKLMVKICEPRKRQKTNDFSRKTRD